MDKPERSDKEEEQEEEENEKKINMTFSMKKN
jgi:hypothetical protein